MIKSILVICLGNICRSPMAEGILKSRFPDLQITSAGLEDLTAGWSADTFARRAARENGIDISSHRAKPITGTLVKNADLILTMDSTQRDIIRCSFPNYQGKVMRIGEFGNFDVPDPYCQPMAAFRETFRLLSEGIDEIGRRVIRPEAEEA